MKDFADLAPRVTGTFPNVATKDDTIPGDKTGTPLAAFWTTEVLGFFQHAVNANDATPSGSSENATTSQVFDALRTIFAPPGEIVVWAGQADPIPSKYRLLPLEGQGVLVATYAELAAVVYCGDGNNGTAETFYRSTDEPGSSRSTSGAYIQLPDMRDEFIRGLKAAREMGDHEDYALQVHGHEIWEGKAETTAAVKQAIQDGSGLSFDVVRLNGSSPGIYATEDSMYGAATLKTDEDETRPTNRAFRICIRY